MRYPTQAFRQRILTAGKITFTFRGRKLVELARLIDAAPSDLVGALSGRQKKMLAYLAAKKTAMRGKAILDAVFGGPAGPLYAELQKLAETGLVSYTASSKNYMYTGKEFVKAVPFQRCWPRAERFRTDRSTWLLGMLCRGSTTREARLNILAQGSNIPRARDRHGGIP